MMSQNSTSATSPTAAVTAQPAPNITRSESVVGGTAPAATGTLTTGQPIAPAGAQSQPMGGPGGLTTILMFALIGGFILMMFLSQRKETKRRAELMASLQRNDKVQTMGGIIGSIAEIDNGEVVIKTDEASNTRIRVSKAAIAQVLNRSTATKA